MWFITALRWETLEHLSIRQVFCVRYFDDDELQLTNSLIVFPVKMTRACSRLFTFYASYTWTSNTIMKFTRAVCVFLIYYLQINPYKVNAQCANQTKMVRPETPTFRTWNMKWFNIVEEIIILFQKKSSKCPT